MLPAGAGLRVTHRHAVCNYQGKCRPLLFCTGICVSQGYFQLSPHSRLLREVRNTAA